MPIRAFRTHAIILILVIRIVKQKIRKFRISFQKGGIAMTFAENINRICAEKGTNLTAVIKTVKGSSSFATAINKGSLPKESEMLEMAKLLECSVMDFFADEDDLPNIKPTNEDEGDILRIYRGLSRRAKHEFMSMAYDFENREELEGDKGTTEAV